MTPSEEREPSGAARMFGDFAPALVGFTDDVLFGQVWERPELSPKERRAVVKQIFDGETTAKESRS